MKIHAMWLSASVAALGWSGAAGAQTTTQSPQDTAKPVQEVVVTAERRSTNLQQTPIAATVLTESDLIKKGVFTVDQLQFVSPSLAVDNFGQGNDIDIRGIGKGEHNTQTGTGVVTYRDGVASFPGYFQEEPYYDIANIEVLRGPQGTFSGQNATGGAVIVNTQNPVIGGKYDGYIYGRYGNYNDTNLQGAVNIPINDTLAARIAFNGEYRDSFYDVSGLTKGDPNVYNGSARFSLLWAPTSNLKVLWKTDYSYLDNGGYFGDAILNPVTGKVNNTDNLFKFANNYETYAVDQFVRSSIKVDYVDSNGIDFRSITGFQRGRTGWKGDIDGTASVPPENNYIIAEKADETIWSQEFNIISPDKGPIRWILGANYQHNQYDFPPIFQIGVPPGGFDEDFDGDNLTHNYGAFGQVTFELPAGFELQAGARYTQWSTTNKTIYFVPEYAPLFNQAQDERYSGSNVTGKVTLNWNLDSKNFLYAFVASGAKPGGLNTTLYTLTAAFTPTPIPAPFKQEYVTDYEIGWKSRLFGDHVRTQIGAYYNDFKDFQVVVPLPNNPLAATELNSPKATLYGLEAQAQAVFGDLQFSGGLGLEHTGLGTFYTEDPRVATSATPCDPSTGPASSVCFNLKGHPQTYAPNFTYQLSGTYTFHVANGDTVAPTVSFSHISSQYGTLFDNQALGDELSARDILGANIAWTHGSIVLSAYGTNLTDDQYISALLPPIRLAGAPRQFGVSVLKVF